MFHYIVKKKKINNGKISFITYKAFKLLNVLPLIGRVFSKFSFIYIFKTNYCFYLSLKVI